ncbi:histidine phosphatase family protein [Bifidobacterium sp. ESL0784]|uniref:histidine phosphatase family protein n=1 Tax=Bifidobacterium sp. ESL0784 TaxID=2983231 RepID=UPI0023F6BE7E|nr:histidine phosphatase family protein [Bifidobacterium sp. ESL0784]MDF7640542.1 histidine phosphatase family protein [Bifidobacterium sp. ESL0784]
MSEIVRDIADTSPEEMTIFLTRHSQTTANTMQLMQGWSDFPITREGRAIIECFGRGLRGVKFANAYCGTLSRHYDTARGALDGSGNENVPIHFDPDLREANFGSFEGREIPEIVKIGVGNLGYKTMDEFLDDRGSIANLELQDSLYALDRRNVIPTDLAPEDRAESSKQIQDRMVKAMTRIAVTSIAEGGGNILVVSSGLSIREFLYTIDHGFDFSNHNNTAVTKIGYRDGKFMVTGPMASMEYYERGKNNA